MRSYAFMTLVVGSLLAATPCLAQNPQFYFTYPTPAYANQFQAASDTRYVPPAGPTVINTQRSGIGTSGAGSSAGLKDSFVTSSLSATTATGPYSQNRMSHSGIGAIALAWNIPVWDFATNTFNVEDPVLPNTFNPQLYYGRISSDVYADGTPCNLSGSISAGWGHGGNGNVRRGLGISVIIVTSNSRLVASYVASTNNAYLGAGQTLQVVTRVNNGMPQFQNVEVYNGAPPTLPFATTAVVGDIVLISSTFDESVNVAQNGTDTQNFTVNVDVN